jgi:hypothetical protein
LDLQGSGLLLSWAGYLLFKEKVMLVNQAGGIDMGQNSNVAASVLWLSDLDAVSAWRRE